MSESKNVTNMINSLVMIQEPNMIRGRLLIVKMKIPGWSLYYPLTLLVTFINYFENGTSYKFPL